MQRYIKIEGCLFRNPEWDRENPPKYPKTALKRSIDRWKKFKYATPKAFKLAKREGLVRSGPLDCPMCAYWRSRCWSLNCGECLLSRVCRTTYQEVGFVKIGQGYSRRNIDRLITHMTKELDKLGK